MHNLNFLVLNKMMQNNNVFLTKLRIFIIKSIKLGFFFLNSYYTQLSINKCLTWKKILSKSQKIVSKMVCNFELIK